MSATGRGAARVEQTSFLPLPCPCGRLPIEREEGLMNWCRCEELVTMPNVEAWNEWAQRSEA